MDMYSEFNVLKTVQSTPSSKLYDLCVSGEAKRIEGAGSRENIENLLDLQSRQTNIYVVV